MKDIVTTNLFDKTVTVELHMSRHYESIMMAIETKSTGSTEDQFLSGVQCVVWGSLYVEALTNRVATRFLDRKLFRTPKLKPAIWKLIERADLDKKVEALADMADCDKSVSDAHLRNLRKLIRLRNRLVHYKEAPTPANASFLDKTTLEIMGLEEVPPEGITYGQVQEKINSGLPLPHIVSMVLSMPFEERRNEILSVGEWIYSLHPFI